MTEARYASNTQTRRGGADTAAARFGRPGRGSIPKATIGTGPEASGPPTCKGSVLGADADHNRIRRQGPAVAATSRT